MKLYCPKGHIYKTREFHRAPDETHCIEPGCNGRLQTGMERNAQKKRGGGGLQVEAETDAHREAREAFNELVCEWPCWAAKHRPCEQCKGAKFNAATGEVCAVCNGDGKHHCRGPKDAHHLLPKEWIERHFGDLPEHKLLAIKFNPILGMPACRYGFHDALESRADVVCFEELDRELILYCEREDKALADNPPPTESRRRSLLERLMVESPLRPETAAI